MEAAEQSHMEKGLPAPFQHVFVICPDFRCLGYVDSENVWRMVYSGAAISEVIDWEPIDS
jgi:hypothetical protein